VGPIHVGIRHHHDLVVPHLIEVELLLRGREPRPERCDNVLDLIVLKDAVEACLLHVQNLSSERQNRLKVTIAGLLGRAARRVALHQVQLRLLRGARRAVRQLARQPAARERILALHELAGLARRGPRLGGRNHLVDNRLGLVGVVLQPAAQLGVDQRLDQALHLRVAELRLRLPLELRLGHLHGQDRREALPEVVAREVELEAVEHVLLLRVGLQGAGEGPTKAGNVGAPLVRVDVVDEREDVLVVAVVVPHGQLDGHLALLLGNVDRVVDDRVARLVEVLHKALNSLFRVVFLAGQVLIRLAVILDDNAHPCVQVGQLAEAIRERLEPKLRRLEDLLVGPEANMCTGLLLVAHGTPLLHLRLRHPTAVVLPPHVAVAPHRHLEAGRQRVDARDAHAVQSAGHLVAVLVELATGVEHRHHHLQRRAVLGGVGINRNAAPIVRHRHRPILVQLHLDVIAVPGHRLVDRVVEHLVDEVVQTAHPYVADIHRRALAHGLQAFEHLDIRGRVRAYRAIRKVSCLTHKRVERGRSKRRASDEDTNVSVVW